MMKYVGFILGSILLCLIGLIVGKGLMDDKKSPEMVKLIKEDPDCKLEIKDCVIDVPQFGELKVNVTNRPFKFNKSMDFHIEFQGLRNGALELDLQGSEMDMGFNRYNLFPAERGKWRAKIVYPKCLEKKMNWTNTIIIVEKGTPNRSAVRFTTYMER